MSCLAEEEAELSRRQPKCKNSSSVLWWTKSPTARAAGLISRPWKCLEVMVGQPGKTLRLITAGKGRERWILRGRHAKT